MFNDIFQFALDHNCDIIYRPRTYVSYQIKYLDHHYNCKSRIYNY